MNEVVYVFKNKMERVGFVASFGEFKQLQRSYDESRAALIQMVNSSGIGNFDPEKHYIVNENDELILVLEDERA